MNFVLSRRLHTVDLFTSSKIVSSIDSSFSPVLHPVLHDLTRTKSFLLHWDPYGCCLPWVSSISRLASTAPRKIHLVSGARHMSPQRGRDRPPQFVWVKMMTFVVNTRNCVTKTRNCVSKTRNCVFKMMIFAGNHTVSDGYTHRKHSCRLHSFRLGVTRIAIECQLDLGVLGWKCRKSGELPLTNDDSFLKIRPFLLKSEVPER